MPIPNDLVPVSKPVTVAPVVPSAAPADLIPVYQPGKVGINAPGTGLNVLANQQIAKYEQPIGDVQMAKADLAPIRDDEKAWLKQNKPRLTPEQFDHSLDVFSNKEANFFTKNQYYYDRAGIPQQIKFGETAPDYAHVQSVFGSAPQAQDDSFITTLTKKAWNVFSDIVKLPATLIDMGYNLFGGENSTDFSNWLRTSVEEHKFETSAKSNMEFLGKESGEPFKNMSDLFNSENYHFNTQNIAGAIGSAVGMIGQMALLGGGGAGAAEATGGEALTLSQKLAPFAKATGANTLYCLNSTYDEASKAGLKGRERLGVSLISAIGQGVIMAKMFPQIPVGAVGKDVQQTISKDVVDAFIKEGGAITPESLKAAYAQTLAKSAELIPKAVSKMSPKVKSALMTGGAMVASSAFDNGVLSLDAKLTGRADENAVFSPDAFKNYFNSFVSGAVMGTIGGIVHKTPEEQTDNQSKMAYAYIKEGREGELLHNLNGLAENGQITPEQHADAVARVNGYKRYATETANVKLDDAEREKVFNNIFQDEKVKAHIAALEGNTTMTPAIKEAQIKVLRSESTGYVNEIASAMGRKETPVETAKAATKAGDELPGQPGTPKAMRQEVVKKFTDLNPEYKHIKPAGERPGEEAPTENLQGRFTIINEGRKAEDRIKAGKGTEHDIVEAERYKAFKRLKVGDVLHVHRFLPEAGKRIKVEGRIKQGEKGYTHLLNTFDENGHQVGSIDYQSKNDQLINEILDQGHQVKLIISNVRKNGEVEYQIASKQELPRTKEEIRAEHTMPIEGMVSGRILHERITEHLRGRGPVEPINKPEPTEPVVPAGEIQFEGAKSVFEKATKLFYDIKDAKGSTKKRKLADERKAYLDEHPEVKRIDDNASSILKQLEEKGIIKREGNCP